MDWKTFKKTFLYYCPDCSKFSTDYREYCEVCSKKGTIRKAIKDDYKQLKNMMKNE